MVSSLRQFSFVGVAALSGVLVLSGCATRKYVRQQVQTLEPAIQEVSNATKENAERIDAVDKRAQQGISAPATADTKAVAAQKTADGATQAAAAADKKADTANQGVQQAGNRINTLETRINNLNVNDTYSESGKEAVTFAVNSSRLDDQGKATLDKIASQFSGQRSGYMLELQGYTDNTGSEQYNIGLSQRRVEAVQRYLVSKNIPLHRLSVVGLGEDSPVADNKTRQGRAQNRRVEVRVLTAATKQQTN